MQRYIFLTLALSGLLVGCANGFGGPQSAPAAPPPPGPSSPALSVIAEAAPGSARRAIDPTLGGAVDIDVLTEYAAASGRLCKRVAINRPADAARFSRVACLGPSGWYWTAASIT